MKRYPAVVSITLDPETRRALTEACKDEAAQVSSKARALIREGLRRDGYLTIERAPKREPS